jgi:hypothetical protein
MEAMLKEVREDTACSAGIQKFQTKQLDVISKDIKFLTDSEEDTFEKLQTLEAMVSSNNEMDMPGEFIELKGHLSPQALNQIHNTVAEAVEVVKLKAGELLAHLDEIIVKHSNTAILRCMLNFGTLREMVQESRRWGDNEDINIKGHNHTEIPSINKLSWEEVTRLLHKSPKFAGIGDESKTDQCSKCGETPIPGIMRECNFCSRQYHKSCHEPSFFITHNIADYKLCRPCRDSIHLEQITESLAKWPKCKEFVEKQKKLLEEHSNYMEGNYRAEDECIMRDLAGGDEIWQNILNDIERNTSFVMTRMLQEEDPEDAESTPKKPPMDPPTNTSPTNLAKMQSPSWKIGQSGFLASPQRPKVKGSRLQPRPLKDDLPSGNQNQEAEEAVEEVDFQSGPDPVPADNTPSTPETSKPPAGSHEETPTVKGSETEGHSEDSSEDDSVVAKEELKARRTLRPALNTSYNLRNRKGFGSSGEESEADEEKGIPKTVLRDD